MSKDEPKKEKPDRHITLTVVVSGQPLEVTVNFQEPVQNLVRKALQESGNQGQQPSGWELRRTDGVLLDQGVRVGDLDLVDGMTLFLTPSAGAGG